MGVQYFPHVVVIQCIQHVCVTYSGSPLLILTGLYNPPFVSVRLYLMHVYAREGVGGMVGVHRYHYATNVLSRSTCRIFRSKCWQSIIYIMAPSIYVSIYLSIYLSLYIYIYVSIYLSIYFIYLFIYLSIYLSECRSIK